MAPVARHASSMEPAKPCTSTTGVAWSAVAPGPFGPSTATARRTPSLVMCSGMTENYVPRGDQNGGVRFDTEIILTGPFRSPAQMLAEQEVDGHTSLHDDETAASLGLVGAPIEGPTHFSQFDPLAFTLWGPAWFERGCISSHFQTMVVEGEQVQASLTAT